MDTLLSDNFMQDTAIELATLKNAWAILENKKAEWLAAIIDSGKTNPEAFSNYLLKNGLIKYNQ